MEATLKELLEADIIEELEGPTPWVTPVCVVPKPEKLANSKTSASFDKDAKTEVTADVIPRGLGPILIQEQQGVKRVIAYASRSLVYVERRYPQTEKEGLGLVWVCERFHVSME